MQKSADPATKCYLLIDWVSWRGGVNNVQRACIVPVKMPWGYIKMFTSRRDLAEQRARRWARKNGIILV